MREIKFRGWDFWQKKMLSFDDSGMSPCRWVYDGTMEEMFENAGGDVVFMQYVGVKDKNGVEIYEGDLVRYEDDIDYIYVVRYIEKECRFFATGTTPTQFNNNAGYKITENLTVIGNIYENADILTPEQLEVVFDNNRKA